MEELCCGPRGVCVCVCVCVYLGTSVCVCTWQLVCEGLQSSSLTKEPLLEPMASPTQPSALGASGGLLPPRWAPGPWPCGLDYRGSTQTTSCHMTHQEVLYSRFHFIGMTGPATLLRLVAMSGGCGPLSVAGEL